MHNKKKIVFINQASGYLTIDIVNSFVPEYDEIALISSPIRVQERNLDKKVVLVNTPAHSRASNSLRIIKWIISTIHIFFLLLTRFRKYEFFYITVPPMSYWCSLFLPNKFSILIFDIYPDVLKTFGVKESNIIYQLWARINKYIFKKSHKLFTLSQDLAKKIQKYTNNPVGVINNWSGFTEIVNIEKNENPFILDHSLKDKFIVQYAGNVSASHKIDILLDLAKILENEPKILFLIVGRGNHLIYIKERAKNEGLENIRFLPFQPDKILKYSLSSADISIVVVGDDVADISVPSKIYNLQSLSIPILGISKQNSELSKHIEKYKNGRCFSRDDLSGIANYLKYLLDNSEIQAQLKRNSARAAIDFNYNNAKKYLQQYLN